MHVVMHFFHARLNSIKYEYEYERFHASEIWHANSRVHKRVVWHYHYNGTKMVLFVILQFHKLQNTAHDFVLL